MEVSTEEVPNKSNEVKDIENEHCYVGVTNNRKKVLFYHLSDHNYIIDENHPKKTSKAKRNRTIKITQLRAMYNCKTCGYRTMNREIFSTHQCKNKSASYIPCNKCNKYTTPDGYRKCPKCSYFTKNAASLKVHMRIHAKGTEYKCTECNFFGTDLKDLISHYGKIKDLKCVCGYSTHVKQQMISHERSHSGEKPFSCGICSFSTSDRASLHRHSKRHNKC